MFLLIDNLLVFNDQVVLLKLFGLSRHFGDRLVRFDTHGVLRRLGIKVLIRVDGLIFQLLVLEGDVQFEVDVVLMGVEEGIVLRRWWI